jgi:large subunit ribosomal protein L27Ae
MRTFHLKRNLQFCPTVNVDRLWSLLPEGVYEKTKAGSELTPVLDVTKLVSLLDILHDISMFLHCYLI